MKKLLILTSLVSTIAGCANPELVLIEPVPFAFQKTVVIPPVSIRVYGADQRLYETYIDKLREQSKFHNLQIDEYNDSFIKEPPKSDLSPPDSLSSHI